MPVRAQIQRLIDLATVPEDRLVLGRNRRTWLGFGSAAERFG